VTAGWLAPALVVIVALVIGLVMAAGVQGARFSAHLAALERAVDLSSERRVARGDLPPEVAALAHRLGARSDGGTVTVRQRGQMWSKPGARPIAFVARQTASPTRVGYVWNARLAPGHLINAADYYAGGVGGLEVKALGLVDLVHAVGGPEMEQGEVSRYLAELPWNPDAILLNPELDWVVLGPRTLRVARRDVVVTFVLGDDGLPKSMSAPSRPYMAKGGARAVPWSGRFGGYQRMSGRLIPTQGEVAWTLDGQEFVYWRGTVTAWSVEVGAGPSAP
jgi:hypothetical protein